MTLWLTPVLHLGYKNSHGSFPVAATQAKRAQGFRRTLTGLLQLPYVIGADWFQYSDEPTHGREDGENFNFGLVDIHPRITLRFPVKGDLLTAITRRSRQRRIHHEK